jgi:hypothetical protein
VKLPALPRTTWVPGEGARPDDGWLRALDADLLVEVGVLLFDRGQGFEAHEAWELAWKDAKARAAHDEERLLRALIKLAAAMVKVRQANPVGVRDHAQGARQLLEALAAEGTRVLRGIRVGPLVDMARHVEAEAERLAPAPVGHPIFGKISRG